MEGAAARLTLDRTAYFERCLDYLGMSGWEHLFIHSDAVRATPRLSLADPRERIADAERNAGGSRSLALPIEARAGAGHPRGVRPTSKRGEDDAPLRIDAVVAARGRRFDLELRLGRGDRTLVRTLSARSCEALADAAAVIAATACPELTPRARPVDRPIDAEVPGALAVPEPAVAVVPPQPPAAAVDPRPASRNRPLFSGIWGPRLTVDDGAVYWSYEGDEGGAPRVYWLAR